MQKTLDAIQKDILNLPKDQRLTIVHRVLKSTEPEETSAMDQLWDKEIIRRIERVDSEEVKKFSASEVLRELGERFSK